MVERLGLAKVVLCTTGLVLAGSCANQPAVTSEGLALRRVIVYRNGVAYFEREGRVTGNRVGFRVRQDEVGDFLASFAVMEKNGSSVRAASFPMHREERPTPVPPAPNANAAAAPTPADPKRKLETVAMELDGAEHELRVGYIAEAPVWRPSYRLVLDKDRVRLQVWGIVQNLSGEDWKDTQLTLVADAPLALQTRLEQAVIPSRPVLEDGNEVIAVVPQSETSLANAPAPPSPVAAAPETMNEEPGGPSAAPELSRNASAMGSLGKAKGEKKAAGRALRAPAAAMANQKRVSANATGTELSSRTRNLAALAAVAVSGGATRYDLPNRVTVPDGSATMLLLLDRDIPGESSFLFAPDPGVPDSASHPFRVARFTNKTGGLLERGPLAFFGEGGFLGQGVIDGLPDGASATVPFALEHGLAIERHSEYIQEGSRLFMVDAGRLTVQRQVGPRSHYAVRNGTTSAHKLWLKHNRLPGSKLVNPPANTEDNLGTGSALVPTQVPAQSTTELVLDERRAQQQPAEWLSDLADQAVTSFLTDATADPGPKAALKAAWDTRGEWKKLSDEAARLHTEQNDLEQSSEETRDNLRAIEKNKAAEDLRKTLTARLAKSSARLDQIMKRLIQVDMQTKEVELRFRDAIKDLHISPRA